MIKWIKYNEITPLQVFFLIPGIEVATGILSLYGDIFEAGAGHDAWISLLIGGFVAQMGIIMAVKLSSYYPQDTIYQYSQKILGKVLGNIFSVLLIIYYYMFTAGVLMKFSVILKIWTYPKTPIIVIFFLLVLPCFYVARNNLKVSARFVQASIILTFWIIVFLI